MSAQRASGELIVSTSGRLSRAGSTPHIVSPDTESSLRAVIRRRQEMGVNTLQLHPFLRSRSSRVCASAARAGEGAPPSSAPSSSVRAVPRAASAVMDEDSVGTAPDDGGGADLPPSSRVFAPWPIPSRLAPAPAEAREGVALADGKGRGAEGETEPP